MLTFMLVISRIESKLSIIFDSKWEVYFVLFLQLQINFVDDTVNPKVNRGYAATIWMKSCKMAIMAGLGEMKVYPKKKCGSLFLYH